jgi:ribose-phosphate pyrophosphokinase
LCDLLAQQGIEQVTAACTHGVFVGDAFARLAAAPAIGEIVTTDTVHIPPDRRPPHLTVLTVAPIFAEAIRCNYERKSIGDLFVYGEPDEETGD